jgi:hypothetical protein
VRWVRKNVTGRYGMALLRDVPESGLRALAAILVADEARCLTEQMEQIESAYSEAKRPVIPIHSGH